MQGLCAVLRWVDVSIATLHEEYLRRGLARCRATDARLEASAEAVGQCQRVGLVVLDLAERDTLVGDLPLGLELLRHLPECVPAGVVVVADELLGRLDTFADRPARVARVEVSDEHLEVFARRCRQRELETPVDVVAELPQPEARLPSLERDGVLEVARVVHLDRLGVEKIVALALVLTPRSAGEFDVIGQRVLERQCVVALDRAVAEARVVDFAVE